MKIGKVVQDSAVTIIRLERGPFGTNAYIVVCQATLDSVVVDVPGESDEIVGQLANTNPKYILITHNHFDHVMALDELKAKLKVPVAAHSKDAVRLPSRPDIEFGDGDTIEVGKLKIKVLHTPGHTPGSLCLLVGRYLISGDTIFPGGPGKTGTPADFKQIVKSIETRLFVFPEQ